MDIIDKQYGSVSTWLSHHANQIKERSIKIGVAQPL